MRTGRHRLPPDPRRRQPLSRRSSIRILAAAGVAGLGASGFAAIPADAPSMAASADAGTPTVQIPAVVADDMVAPSTAGVTAVPRRNGPPATGLVDKDGPSAPPVSTLPRVQGARVPTTTPTRPSVSTARTSASKAPTPKAVPAKPRPPAPAPSKPPPAACPTVLSGAVAQVAQAGHAILRASGFGGAVLGRAGRGGTSDHPSGYALDFMVGLGNNTMGDRIANYALANRARLGVTYVIWRQRYNDGSGWTAMASRGSATANHMDHVHVSFSKVAPGKITC